MQHKIANRITLLSVQYTDVNLGIHSFDEDVTRELKTHTFKVNCLLNSEEGRHFGIQFQIKLRNESKDFSLELRAVAHFESDIELDKEFLESHFITVNAPAIAFPYIRTFISNLTLNAGYNPVMLPSINFAALNEKRSKSLSSNTKKSIN